MKKTFTVIMLFIAITANCQSKTAAYVFLLGADTVGYEQYTRTAEKIEGDIVTFFPRTTVAHFKAILTSSLGISRFEYTSAYSGSDGKLMEREISIDNDTAVHQS